MSGADKWMRRQSSKADVERRLANLEVAVAALAEQVAAITGIIRQAAAGEKRTDGGVIVP